MGQSLETDRKAHDSGVGSTVSSRGGPPRSDARVKADPFKGPLLGDAEEYARRQKEKLGLLPHSKSLAINLREIREGFLQGLSDSGYETVESLRAVYLPRTDQEVKFATEEAQKMVASLVLGALVFGGTAPAGTTAFLGSLGYAGAAGALGPLGSGALVGFGLYTLAGMINLSPSVGSEGALTAVSAINGESYGVALHGANTITNLGFVALPILSVRPKIAPVRLNLRSSLVDFPHQLEIWRDLLPKLTPVSENSLINLSNNLPLFEEPLRVAAAAVERGSRVAIGQLKGSPEVSGSNVIFVVEQRPGTWPPYVIQTFSPPKPSNISAVTGEQARVTYLGSAATSRPIEVSNLGDLMRLPVFQGELGLVKELFDRVLPKSSSGLAGTLGDFQRTVVFGPEGQYVSSSPVTGPPRPKSGYFAGEPAVKGDIAARALVDAQRFAFKMGLDNGFFTQFPNGRAVGVQSTRHGLKISVFPEVDVSPVKDLFDLRQIAVECGHLDPAGIIEQLQKDFGGRRITTPSPHANVKRIDPNASVPKLNSAEVSLAQRAEFPESPYFTRNTRFTTAEATEGLADATLLGRNAAPEDFFTASFPNGRSIAVRRTAPNRIEVHIFPKKYLVPWQRVDFISIAAIAQDCGQPEPWSFAQSVRDFFEPPKNKSISGRAAAAPAVTAQQQKALTYGNPIEVIDIPAVKGLQQQQSALVFMQHDRYVIWIANVFKNAAGSRFYHILFGRTAGNGFYGQTLAGAQRILSDLGIDSGAANSALDKLLNETHPGVSHLNKSVRWHPDTETAIRQRMIKESGLGPETPDLATKRVVADISQIRGEGSKHRGVGHTVVLTVKPPGF